MVGIVFPGLAPSYFHDVKDFVKNNRHAQRRYDEASVVLGYSLLEAFAEAKPEDSEVLESSFFINTISLLDFYYEKFNYQPKVTIGPSFGGMAAAVQLQSLTFEETIWLTHESSKYSKMWFERLGSYQTLLIYNLLLEDLENVLKKYIQKGIELEIVGYMGKVLCVCGKTEHINQLKQDLNKIRKCFSVDTLNYPMHSKILTPLKFELEKKIYSQVEFKELKNPLISDVDGKRITSKDEFKQTLLDGNDHPVRWDLIIKTLKMMELSDIYVIGPKNIFAQLLKNQFNTINVNTDNSIRV